MRGHAAMLALAASLTWVGAVPAAEQDPIATGSIPSATAPGHPAGHSPAGAGFGFSPFLEEGLVAELPRARRHEVQRPVPAYVRELREAAD